ncbi:MAG: hypothetical protein ACJ0SL_05180 [Candidatus Rariloculaceae bacterium]
MRKKSYIRNLLCKLTLAFLFVAAQTAVASHVDVDQHSQEASCAICLSVSAFDCVNVGDTALAIPVSYSPEPVHEWNVFVSADVYESRRARAPPIVS